jgi:protein-tyrosine phosphatase
MKKISVLFVCMGNICRSPAAEGVFRQLVHKEGLENWFEIDSAGTHAYHLGNPPDERTQKSALARGISLAGLRARQVAIADFSAFDHILAMDRDNYDALMFVCPKPHAHKVQLFLEYAPELRAMEVPDPYYGGEKGFERVLDMVEAAAQGFLGSVRDKLC